MLFLLHYFILFQALNGEIADHKGELDDVVLSGIELLKHSSGDDTGMVQDRIDFFKNRYQNLADRSADRLNKMEEALPLAIKFHDTHEKLVNWLQMVEPELRGKEPIGPEAEAHVLVSTISRHEIDQISMKI